MIASQRHRRTAAALKWTLPAVLAGLLSGCATPIEPAVAGYACCNLRMQYGWISSNNVQGGTLLPVGEPVQMTTIKRQYYVYGRIGGLDVALRDDASKSEAQTLQWVRSIIVKDDPRLQLAAWPSDIRAAVLAARVVIGMSRAQVLMALGPPSRIDTPDMAAASWRYWTEADDLPVDLHFGSDDRLQRIEGKPTAVRVISLQS